MIHIRKDGSLRTIENIYSDAVEYREDMILILSKLSDNIEVNRNDLLLSDLINDRSYMQEKIRESERLIALLEKWFI